MTDTAALLIVAASLVGAYLLGSIPFALLLARTRGIDIRQHGSGNVGASNLGRVLGKKFGLACLVLDVAKGFVPVLGFGIFVQPALGEALGPAMGTLVWLGVAAAAVLGHIFPIWLGFKGGKGVATGLGVVLGFWPVLTIPGLVAAVIWLVVCKSTAYVSLASVCAALALPLLTVVNALVLKKSLLDIVLYTSISTALALLVVIRHRGNLARLRQGTEPKVTWAGKRL